jgi:hypothetical protein
VLHVSNIVREYCKDDKKLRSLFEKYGNVEGIKFIFGEKNKNMCLVKMSSLEESLSAMAHLHNVGLGDRKLQISFTRSKI